MHEWGPVGPHQWCPSGWARREKGPREVGWQVLLPICMGEANQGRGWPGGGATGDFGGVDQGSDPASWPPQCMS